MMRPRITTNTSHPTTAMAGQPLTVCVYGSASKTTRQDYLDASRELGRLLAAGGHLCVNGGGRSGAGCPFAQHFSSRPAGSALPSGRAVSNQVFDEVGPPTPAHPRPRTHARAHPRPRAHACTLHITRGVTAVASACGGLWCRDAVLHALLRPSPVLSRQSCRRMLNNRG